MKFLYLLLFSILLMGDPSYIFAKSKKKKKSIKEVEEINYIDLAALMIQDGFYAKAEKALKKVDITQEDLDFKRFYTLSGLVYLQSRKFKKSIRSFQKSISYGQDNLIIYVYLAQAYYGSGKYQETINALLQSGVQGERPSLYKIRINCHWQIKQKTETFSVLRTAESKWPKMTEFTKQKIIYLISLGLYKKASEEGIRFLRRPDSLPDDYLLIGESMRRSKQHKEAIKILELARLKYKFNEKIIYALAHTYSDQKSYRSAANLFEEASYINPKYTAQAVELYRKAKQYTKAISLNAEVKDQKVKTKQRLGILLAQKRYSGVVSLKDRLNRLNLFEDQKITYAYAYALFKTGDFDTSIKYLKTVVDDKLYSKRVKLREAIAVYQKSEWQLP